MRDDVVLRDGWRWPPLLGRLPQGNGDVVRQLHEEAIRHGHVTYVDPRTRLSVFTADFLASRGYCCESCCRHCPYVAD